MQTHFFCFKASNASSLSLSLSLSAQSPTQKLFQVSSVFAWMNESGVQRMKLEIEIVRSSSFKEISNYFFFLNREIEAELKTLRDTFYWWLWLTMETTQMFDALVFLKKQGCQTKCGVRNSLEDELQYNRKFCFVQKTVYKWS